MRSSAVDVSRYTTRSHLEQRSFDEHWPAWQSAEHWQSADHWPEVAEAKGFVWVLLVALEAHASHLASLLVVASLWLFAAGGYDAALPRPHAGRLWRPLVPALTLLGCCVAFRRQLDCDWTVEALAAEASLAWRRVCEGLETLTAPSYCRGTLAAGWQAEAEPSEEPSESLAPSESLGPTASLAPCPSESLAPSESLGPTASLAPSPSEDLTPLAGKETLSGILPQGSEVTKEARPRSRLARCLRGGVKVAFLGFICVLF